MTKQLRKLSLVVLILAVFTSSIFASPLQGELNGSLVYDWDKDGVEHVSSVTGFKFILEDYVEAGKLHFSTKGWWDWKAKDGELGVDQLWFSGYAGDVDYTVGRQAISWGTADGFNPTNYFARMSSAALSSGDLSGEPLWAGQASYYAPNWSITGVVVPFFKPQTIDAEMKKIMAEQDDTGATLNAIENTKKPAGLGKNSEWGIRAETQVAGFDLQASVFSGFEPLPGLELTMITDAAGQPGFAPMGKYRRQYFGGLAATGTIGSVGVWGEAAYGGPKPFAEAESAADIRIPMSINKNYLQLVLGGDYTFALGKGLLAQGQYIYRGQGSLFAPYVAPDFSTGQPQAGEIKGAHYLYGRLGYDFNQDSSVDLVVLHDVRGKSGLVRPAYTHRFPNSIQLEASVVAIYGKGDLASLPQQARLALSYKF